MELGWSCSENDRWSLDHDELETTHYAIYGQTTREMNKRNQKNSRVEMATSGNGSLEMEGGLHPAGYIYMLNKKKEVDWIWQSNWMRFVTLHKLLPWLITHGFNLATNGSFLHIFIIEKRLTALSGFLSLQSIGTSY